MTAATQREGRVQYPRPSLAHSSPVGLAPNAALTNRAYYIANQEHKGDVQGHPTANRPSLYTRLPEGKGYSTTSTTSNTTIPTVICTMLVARVRRQPSAQGPEH
jgi:hypothetical protein